MMYSYNITFSPQVTDSRVRISESVREMEAHKAKRLAARNEMIGLAKVRGRVFVWVVLSWCDLLLVLFSYERSENKDMIFWI